MTIKNDTAKLKLGKDLTVEESEIVFRNIMRGVVRDEEIIDFLLALKEKGENTPEIFGAAKVLKDRAIVVDLGKDIIDVCGTGGDGLNTLNISTAVAFVLAGAGIKVAKHGNKAVSSISGSADVLTELGIDLKAPAQKQIESGMAFFFAPAYHPAMKTLAELRKQLNTRTIFNILGPLLNPAGTKRQLIGIYSPRLLRIFAEVLLQLGSEKAWVVHGSEGMDEISITGETQVCELDKGTIDTFTITPEDAGLSRGKLEDIKGGDAKFNAAAIIDLLKGKAGTYRDIVLLNAAAGLMVADKVSDLKEGVKLAAESIDSGKALQVLEKLKTLGK